MRVAVFNLPSASDTAAILYPSLLRAQSRVIAEEAGTGRYILGYSKLVAIQSQGDPSFLRQGIAMLFQERSAHPWGGKREQLKSRCELACLLPALLVCFPRFLDH